MAMLGYEHHRWGLPDQGGLAWMECECCGEQSDPVELYDDETAADTLPEPSRRECYRCADDGCECITLLAVFAGL